MMTKYTLALIFICVAQIASTQKRIKYDSLVVAWPTDVIIDSAKAKWLNSNDLDSSIWYYRHALYKDSFSLVVNYGLGYAYAIKCFEKNRNCKLAINLLQVTNRIKPGFRKTHYNLALCYFLENDYKKAEKHAKLSVGQKQVEKKATFLLALIYHEQKKPEKACLMLKKARKSGVNKQVKWEKKDCY